MFLVKLMFFMMTLSSCDFYAMHSDGLDMLSRVVTPILAVKFTESQVIQPIAVRSNQNLGSEVDDLTNNLKDTSLTPRRKVKASRELDQSAQDSQKKLSSSLIIAFDILVKSNNRPLGSPIPMIKRGFESFDSHDDNSSELSCSRQKRLKNYSFLPVDFVEQSGCCSKSF